MDGKAAEIKLEGVTDPRRAGESLNRPDESKLSSGRSLLSPFSLASPALASSCAVRCPAGMVGRGKPCAALSDGWLNAPTKRLLLEERPFGRLSPQLSQIATPDFRTRSCPRGTLIADQRGRAQHDRRGKRQKRAGGACSRPGDSSFSLPRGLKRQCRLPVLFNRLLRHTQVLWYFPCTPRATALRQARVSGGNLQNCAPSAACGGAMAPRKYRPPSSPCLPPHHQKSKR